MSYPPYAHKGKGGGREGAKLDRNSTRRGTRLEASTVLQLSHQLLSKLRHARPNPAYRGFCLPPSLPPSPPIHLPRVSQNYILEQNLLAMRHGFSCVRVTRVCVSVVYMQSYMARAHECYCILHSAPADDDDGDALWKTCPGPVCFLRLEACCREAGEAP